MAGEKEYDAVAMGRRLKGGIIDRGHTIESFAEEVGISRMTIGEYCQGRGGMSLNNAVIICNALDKPLDWLVRRGEYAETA